MLSSTPQYFDSISLFLRPKRLRLQARLFLEKFCKIIGVFKFQQILKGYYFCSHKTPQYFAYYLPQVNKK